jgi:hypothetical protein
MDLSKNLSRMNLTRVIEIDGWINGAEDDILDQFVEFDF